MARLLTFVFQPKSSCRHANIREEVEVELVGGAVEERRDGGAWGGGRLIVGAWQCFPAQADNTDNN